MRPLFFCLSISLLTLYARPVLAEGDPLLPIYAGETPSSVASLIDHFRQTRRYRTEDFPMEPEKFPRLPAGRTEDLHIRSRYAGLASPKSCW
ncbi:MAG: hypothetical protein R2724_24715 [Bryobacterales bacterium]